MFERRVGGHQIKLAVAHSPIVLSPRHLVRVGVQVRPGDVMVNPDLRTAKSAEEAFRLICASLAVRVSERVIDPLDREMAVQMIPVRRFVGVDRAAFGHALADSRDRRIFGERDEGKRFAVALAHDHDNATLGRAHLAAVYAVILEVGRAHMAADVEAINFDFARSLFAINAIGNGFAELVCEHISRLVLAIEIAAQLKGAMAFGAVDEDGDGQEIVADRKLAACEDCARRDGELVRATLAAVNLARLVGVAIEATAARTNWLALRVGPADGLERLPRFLFRHARDGRQRERPGGCAKEEVLCHNANVFR